MAAAEPMRWCSSLDEFVGEYRNWLAGERALSPDTVRGYTRLAHRFLAERVSAEDELGVQRLTGADVTGTGASFSLWQRGSALVPRTPVRGARSPFGDLTWQYSYLCNVSEGELGTALDRGTLIWR